VPLVRLLRRYFGRAALAAAFAVVSIAGSRTASADPSAQDSAAAQSLYDEARKLTSAGKWTDACPKLEESQRLDPTPVTQFYLADCYEHLGRTASAWTTFLELAAAAHRTGGPKAAERERVAKEKAMALEPKLTKLQIDVPAAARASGLVVKRDGQVVGEGQWGAPVAVDPGKHSVEASAPSKKPWSIAQEVQGAGQVTTVQVASLEDVPMAAAPASAAAAGLSETPRLEEPARGSPPLKAVGLVVAAAGAVGLGVGTYFGLQALSKNSDANNGHCGSSAGFGDANTCDASGVSLRSDAVGAGNLSTVFFVAGGALLATGVTLWLLAPSSHVQAAAAVGPGSGTAFLRFPF
jgi:hypothetical protein